jgi:hypothetical protein
MKRNKKLGKILGQISREKLETENFIMELCQNIYIHNRQKRFGKLCTLTSDIVGTLLEPSMPTSFNN